jgi:hypothetical protein
MRWAEMVSCLIRRCAVCAWAAWICAAHACEPPVGLDQVREAPVLVFGEYHGTNEIPKTFFGTVCSLAQAQPHKRLLVALELPDSFNEVFGNVRRGEMTDVLLAVRGNTFWDSYGDGRHSAAMLELVERLVELARRNARLDLLAIERPDIDRSGAQFLSEQMRRTPPDMTVVLIGNAHARLAPMPGGPTPFAAHLVKLASTPVVTLDVSAARGEAWVCMPQCAARTVMPMTGPFGVSVWREAQNSPFSGRLHLEQLTIAPAVR